MPPHSSKTTQLHAKYCLESFHLHSQTELLSLPKGACHMTKRGNICHLKTFTLIPIAGQELEKTLHLIPGNESGDHLRFINLAEASSSISPRGRAIAVCFSTLVSFLIRTWIEDQLNVR